MFIQFSVENYLSFKGESIFSMVGNPTTKEHEGKNEQFNIFIDPSGKHKILKTSAVYGANGSGKSNLISAIDFFKKFILDSFEKKAGDSIDILHFLLSSETENKPSTFEIVFYIDRLRYRYGFEVDKKEVFSEWLFSLKGEKNAKETKLFTREFQNIIINNKSFKEGKGLEIKTRPNALFLTTVSQFNGIKSTKIINYFRNNFRVVSGLEDQKYTELTIDKFKDNPDFKRQLVEFFKSIKIGFDDIELIENDELLEKLINIPNDIPSELKEVVNDLKRIRGKVKNLEEKLKRKSIAINFLHKKFDEVGNIIELATLDFGLQSKGTQKLFNIFGLIFDTIENGKVLIIDELDSQLHTLLTIELIKFFHTKKNMKGQLIFASHDTNLLKKEVFRRDQVWFAEKNDYGSSEIYSLIEYKINRATVRNDASFERDYLIGKYGAIPFLGDLEKFKNDFLNE